MEVGSNETDLDQGIVPPLSARKLPPYMPNQVRLDRCRLPSSHRPEILRRSYQ